MIDSALSTQRLLNANRGDHRNNVSFYRTVRQGNVIKNVLIYTEIVIKGKLLKANTIGNQSNTLCWYW